MIRCCVAIMAHNEEANIGPVLDALLAQRTETVSIEEIIVVASGCTDRTGEVVEEFAARDDRIRLVRQRQRRYGRLRAKVPIRKTCSEPLKPNGNAPEIISTQLAVLTLCSMMEENACPT